MRVDVYGGEAGREGEGPADEAVAEDEEVPAVDALDPAGPGDFIAKPVRELTGVGEENKRRREDEKKHSSAVHFGGTECFSSGDWIWQGSKSKQEESFLGGRRMNQMHMQKEKVWKYRGQNYKCVAFIF